MAAVLIGFILAAVGMLIGRRAYRHCYNFPQQLRDRSPDAKAVLGWSMPLNVAVMAWGIMNTPPIPQTGLPMVFVIITGFVAVASPFVGMVLGSRHGRKRLAQS